MNTLIRPVILSGGSGTRLWPVSRARHPKQFSDLVGQENLFTGTLRRTFDVGGFIPPIVIGNVEHCFLMQEALDGLAMKEAQIFLEPVGRNTLVAILIAAIAETENLQRGGQKILHLVMPSDHVITDTKAFFKAVQQAQTAAESGQIVLFGIEPTRADVGFGYIMPGAQSSYEGVQKITRFVEKPAEAVALDLIKQHALWNSGIFFYDPEVLCAEASQLAPDDLDLCREALRTAIKDLNSLTFERDLYNKMGNQPFDRAIMEKTDKGVVVRCDIGWNDLGSWEAMWQVEQKDDRENAIGGSVVSRDNHGCYIRSYGPTIAVMGVTDLTVVATKDSVMVAPRTRAQEVRELVGDVGDANETLALDHPRVMRQWGSYEAVAQGDRFQVKHIIITPGHALSLQMHKHRAEHWIVVEGMAEVECDDVKKRISSNESIYIPAGAKHRLSNPGKVDLHIIEVKSGDYLGEDDIVRFDKP
jgi:mannose-1-phosphate guanylyltransferase/mannose-6-phosphate isomerase